MAAIKPAAATKANAQAKPALAPKGAAVQVSPELQAFAVVKLGRPSSLWRWLNRVVAWANGEVSRDEWDLAYETARKFVDGKPMHPEDAARRAEKIICAQLGVDDMACAAVAKCEASDNAVLVAFLGRPASGFYHSRAIRLLDPGGVKRG